MIHRNFIEISVKDTGIGLKLEDLDRILNHLDQVNGSCSRRYQTQSWDCLFSKACWKSTAAKSGHRVTGKKKGEDFVLLSRLDLNVKNPCPTNSVISNCFL